MEGMRLEKGVEEAYLQKTKAAAEKQLEEARGSLTVPK